MTQPVKVSGRSVTWLIYFVALAPFVVTTDFSMIGIVLPGVGREFHLGTGHLSGLVAIYSVAYASLLMAGGRLADILGQRCCATAGLALFALATLLVMLSTSFAVLLLARGLQGAGAALISPACLSLINTVIPEGTHRHRAYRMFGSLQGASSIAGPVIGGALTTAFGWRSAFGLELSLSVILLAAVRSIVPVHAVVVKKGAFDLAGAALIAAGIVCFVAAVSGIGGVDLSSQQRLAAAVLTVVIGAVLYYVERGRDAPLIPSTLFKDRRVILAAVGMTAAMAASTAFFLLPNVLMQQLMGWTAAAAGLGMLPHALAGMLGGQSTGPLMGRYSLRKNTGIAFCLIIGALLLYALLPVPATYQRAILIPMLIGGVGSLLSLMMMMADAASAVGPGEQGVLSALAYSSMQIGSAVGSAVLLSAAAASSQEALPSALRHSFLIAAAIAAVGMICAVGLGRPARRRTTSPQTVS